MTRHSIISREHLWPPERIKHTYLKKSLPESASVFAAKKAEGAVGKSGRKIKLNGLQAKWTLIVNKYKSKTRSTRGIPRSSLRRNQSVQTDGGPCGS